MTIEELVEPPSEALNEEEEGTADVVDEVEAEDEVVEGATDDDPVSEVVEVTLLVDASVLVEDNELDVVVAEVVEVAGALLDLDVSRYHDQFV